MSARLDCRWTYDGQPIVRIENRRLSADLVASMGGKVLNLIDKAADRNVLWRASRVALRPGPIGVDVDDYFAGGWDDAFPTGDACENEYGDRLPYMGELWNLQMGVEVLAAGPQEVRVAFTGQTPITPARVTRTLSLTADQPSVRIETLIENVGYRPFRFCWGSHASLAVMEGMRLDVPAACGEVTDAGGGRLGELGQRYDYPLLGAGGKVERDVRIVPGPELGAHALHALTGLDGGWAAATDPRAKLGFGLRFDRELYRCVWQWMSYGGFRGWYHAILEPWSAPQTSLAAASAAGEALSLAPGESIGTEVLGVLYSGLTRVESIAADGSVHGVAATQ